MKRSLFVNILKSSKGTTSVIFICSTIVVILLSALFTDIGYIAFERYKLAKSVDLIAKLGAEAVFADREECINIIESNAVKRIKDLNKLDVKVSDNNREISLYAGKKLNYIFLKYFGVKEKQIESSVTAKISIVTSYKGIRPFAVEKDEINYGKQYYLSLDVNSQESSIVGEDTKRIVPLSLGDEEFETSIIYGYRKSVNAGRILYAMTAGFEKLNKSMVDVYNRCKHDPPCTYENHEDECPRIFILPVVDKADFSGKNGMTVLGFTAFFVEEVENEDKSNGGIMRFKGRFIRYTVNSSTSDGIADFGLLGVKLIH